MAFVKEQLARMQNSLRSVCGAEMMSALRRGDLEDMALNPDGQLWIKRLGQKWEVIAEIDEVRGYEIVTSVASMRGQEVNRLASVLESHFQLDGHKFRFEAVVPPTSERAVFSLRKSSVSTDTYGDYDENGTATDRSDPRNKRRARASFAQEFAGRRHVDILRAAIDHRKNTLFVGAPGSGKTKLMEAGCREIAARTPEDRVLLIQDIPEIEREACMIPNMVDFMTSDSVDLLKCVRTAMRMRSNRILIGEARGAEAFPLLKAWMTGHPGGMATIHADSAEGGLTRLEALVGEATNTPAYDLIANAVELVVYIEADLEVATGRKLKEIIAVVGYDKAAGGYLTVEM